MKYLTDYTEEGLTDILYRLGAFFAFNKEQFAKEEKEGVKYVSMGAGLICPRDNVKQLIEEMDGNYKKGIETDLKENGKENIIKRELENHECYYQYDVEPAIRALAGYDITDAEVRKIFCNKTSNHYDD